MNDAQIMSFAIAAALSPLALLGWWMEHRERKQLERCAIASIMGGLYRLGRHMEKTRARSFAQELRHPQSLVQEFCDESHA